MIGGSSPQRVFIFVIIMIFLNKRSVKENTRG